MNKQPEKSIEKSINLDDSASIAASMTDAVEQLNNAGSAKKCHSCGCFHDTIDTIHRAYEGLRIPDELAHVLEKSESVLAERRYDCLGCEVCFPPLAVKLLESIPGVPTFEMESC